MKFRPANHKVGAGLADFCAIEQRANVRCFSVVSTLLQAIGDRFQADAVAVRAVLDTLEHLLM